MKPSVRIEVVKAEMKLILRILEDLIQIDGTTQVHLKYLTEYDALRNELRELESQRKSLAA